MRKPATQYAESREDVGKIAHALIVLSGHLPLFSDDRRKVKRAQEHLALRDRAFDALDRIADALDTEHAERKVPQ